jgi:hypothetical protein
MIALTVLFAAASAASATSASLAVEYPAGNEENFKVTLGGATWFENEKVWFQAGGKLFSSQCKSDKSECLTKVGVPTKGTGTDKYEILFKQGVFHALSTPPPFPV